MSRLRIHSNRRARGFTLVELLVVIGIITILIAILVPMVLGAMRQARKARIAADLQTISTALEAFKVDHGDYPRPETANTGFAMLGRYLIGPGGQYTGNPAVGSAPQYTAREYLPGECVREGASTQEYVAITTVPPGTSPTNTSYWAPFQYTDHVVGPGFRTRPGGRIFKPYLTDTFPMRGVALLDLEGNPILYFVANPRTPNLTTPLTTPSGPVPPFVARSPNSLYNADDNLMAFRRPGESGDEALWRLRAMLGDYNVNGLIDAGEEPVTTGPYILWSAGRDGLFGPTEITDNAPNNRRLVERCDDVTNFR